MRFHNKWRRIFGMNGIWVISFVLKSNQNMIVAIGKSNFVNLNQFGGESMKEQNREYTLLGRNECE